LVLSRESMNRDIVSTFQKWSFGILNK
jgi:hypothetical protein